MHRGGVEYRADLSRPISIALPLKPGVGSSRAWGAPDTRNEPVAAGEWLGDVAHGGTVNFGELRLAPHGAGTHTETVAHISPLTEANHVAAIAPAGFLIARLVDAEVSRSDARGSVIELSGLRTRPPDTEALIVRALGRDREDEDFAGTDPPYYDAADIEFLVACGVEHLVTDVPSLDREDDGGALLAHRAFWKYPTDVRTRATVTELARLNQDLDPGLYLLSLNVLPLHADASPSLPILYALSKVV